ncbi:MAG: hypothetical protein Pars2KO_02350 [Parasphingorhabdus sp.]
MALSSVVMIALILASSDNISLQSSIGGSKAVHSNQEIDIECTSVSLEYSSGGRSKMASSNNCSNDEKSMHYQDQQKSKNLPEFEARDK